MRTEKISVAVSIKLPEEYSKYSPNFAKKRKAASNTKESDMRKFKI